ncbi:MAG: amidase [Chloroflexota bacterium]|nr:amidase [Chloroflexota bacterium]
MTPQEICYSSAWDLAPLISKREISPVDVIESHLKRIEETESVLNSFITLLAEEALTAAKRLEAEVLQGKYRGPLHGIPVGLKDLFHTGGVRTTSGSRIFDTYIPTEDCTVAARFNQAGAILLGKLNMHQFAYGPTGENPDYGHMHNPWNPELISGGSSGGSGSAAASGQCTITMGSDTGGSVRIPSSLCGIVGLKPTYGLISRHGLTPLSWSLDHPGPMVRTVEDAALTMNAISGYDTKDVGSANVDIPDFTASMIGDIKNVKIGLVREFFEAPLDAEVHTVTKAAIAQLEALGAEIIEVSMPMFKQAQAISGTILMAEAAAYHRDLLKEHADKLYPPVRLRIESGLFVTAADYLKAQQGRALFNKGMSDLFLEVDALVGPSQPITAPPLLASTVDINGETIGTTAALTQYSRPYNISGTPAISIPCGFSKSGMPIGLQIAGKAYDEAMVLRISKAYQDSTAWHQHRPIV